MEKYTYYVLTIIIIFVVLSPGLVINLPPIDYFKNSEFSEKTVLFTGKNDVYSSITHGILTSIVISLVLYFYGTFENSYQILQMIYVLIPLSILFSPGLFINLPPLKFIEEGNDSIKEENILFTSRSDFLSSSFHAVVILIILIILESFGYASNVFYTEKLE